MVEMNPAKSVSNFFKIYYSALLIQQYIHQWV